ncbi:hypothetical protein [Legionella sp.]|uniref:hypothetical protein n=1 Tax=Legionella sp. TaxID=459 RepID=UPI000CAEA98F|nr:hypothetical protein [Legionella sp.]PJE13402.1 MAG: hypothetical protein CK430_06500 [Legionella sp.]
MRQLKKKQIIIKEKHKPRSEDQIRRATQVKTKPIRPIKQGRKLNCTTPCLRKKPQNKKPRNKGFYGLGLSLVNVLTPKQWMALFFLMSISGAYAIKVNEQLSQSTTVKDDNKKPIKGSLNDKEDCEESSLATFNKPDIRLGAREGKLIPASCLEGNNATCLIDQKTMSSFEIDVPKMNAVYAQILKKNTKWQASITLTLKKISATIISEEIKDIFHSWIREVTIFKSAYHSIQSAYAAGGGTCDNHKDLALIKIFSQAIKFGLEVKVQVVIVFTDETQTSFKTNIGKNHPLNGHTYLLIDSEIEDVMIKNDRAAVAKYLDAIKSGRIHDTWNKNCREINSETSGFYHDAAYWDTLYIQSVTLDFEGLKKLPIAAQRLLCQELASAGLPVELNQTCGLFTRKGQKHSEQRQNLQTQQSFVL